jgi:hypothetical protein
VVATVPRLGLHRCRDHGARHLVHLVAVVLTTAQVQAELERVTYKPGWTITCYDGRHEGQHLTIRADLPDACNPGDTVTIQVETALPPIPDVDYLHAWLIWRLCRIESHEAREFYRVDGKPVFDPHAPYAERDL